MAKCALDPLAEETYPPPVHMKKDAAKKPLGWLGLLFVLGLLAGTLLPGCYGTPTNPDDHLYGNFSGVYVNPAGGAIISTNSGNPVTKLTITQSPVTDAHSVLSAVDNNGHVFTGTFSVAYAYGGMIQLDGAIGTGMPVHITGYLETSETNSSAWLDATWIEPDLTGAMYGSTTITPFSPTNPAAWSR